MSDNTILTITDPTIIKFAWGPRRVTSSKRYGTLTEEDAYPKSVTASKGMWVDWILDNADRWLDGHEPYVVIPATKAEKRIRDQLVGVAEEVPSLPQDEIDRLLLERRMLRAAKNFEEADAVRSHLEKHNVIVNDEKLST